MINRLTGTVWPSMTKAILDFAITGDLFTSTVGPLLKEQVFDKVSPAAASCSAM
jgi:hypothetical protein